MASQFAKDLVNIQPSFCDWGGKCWQTDSIGADGYRLPCEESIGLTAGQFARDLVNMHLSGVAGVEKVGKGTPSEPMDMGCREKSPSDSPEVSS